MSLAPGTRLGTYEVVALLGAGGMGQVYRARDTRLNRDVAIKVLPPEVAGDRDRLLRFEREAQTLAALNHPNIAQIFGVIEEPAALVMELVPGDDLSQRIGRTAMSPDDAVPIALQIAHALEAAHEQGIIHRDLKPANVKVRADGTVKVLDFGLAKIAGQPDALDTPLADSPTRLSPAVTHHGVILGTAGYMAPEQAKGRAADKRADIWAFGVVLFEMLAGRPPFGGEGVTETIARVIERDPDWAQLPATTPPHLRELMARCLVKDPQRRLRDIGDARIALESPAMSPSSGSATVSASARRAIWLPVAATLAVVALALIGYQGFGARSSAVPDASVRQLRLPTTVATVPAGSDFAAVISPDGQKIAMFSASGVSVRWLADGRTIDLVKNDDVRQVFWSPDSRWIGYATVSQIAKVSLDGGTPFVMASLRGVPGPFNVFSGQVAWFSDDRLVFTTGFSGLMEVRPPGTTPVEVVPPDSETMDFHGAHALPDGGVLTSVHDGDLIERFEVVRGRERIEVFRDAGAQLGMPIYASTGHLLFPKLGQTPGVWAVPFDLDSTRVTGAPFLVLAGILTPSVSADGQMLVATPPAPTANGRITIMSRDAAIERQLSPQFSGRMQHPGWSPDGRRIIVALPDAPGVFSTSTLFILSDDGRAATQMTSGVDVAAGRFFPDGQRVLVETGSPLCMSADCYSIGWKGPEDDRIRPIVSGMSGAISPDGTTLVYASRVRGAEWDLFTAAMDGSRTPAPFQGGIGWQIGPRFSPDGRWVAYVSTESGRPEIWVAAYPTGGKWRVSQDAGYWPRWLGDGTALLFARGTAVVQVPFTPGVPPSFGAPIEIFPTGTLMQMQILRFPFAFDVTRDGHRFVLIKNPQTSATMTVEVLQRWLR